MAVKRTHSIATIQNTSDTPVAYFLAITAKGNEECRGSRKHNAMALLPGESAEVLACPGKESFVVEDLRVLEVTPIGYVYVSKLPPTAVGHTAEVARAHTGANVAESCSQIPAVKIASRIQGGELAWEDLVDYFSRHNCERHAFPAAYRRTTEPITKFPYKAVAAGQASPAGDPKPNPSSGAPGGSTEASD
jgi:hypothetical protein